MHSAARSASTELLLACEADARGRTGLEHDPYPQSAYLRGLLAAAAAVTLSADDRAGLAGRCHRRGDPAPAPGGNRPLRATPP